MAVALDGGQEVGHDAVLLPEVQAPLPKVPGADGEPPGADLASRRAQEEAGVGGARDGTLREADQLLNDLFLPRGRGEKERARDVSLYVRPRFREKRRVADVEEVVDHVQAPLCRRQVHDGVAVDGGLSEIGSLLYEVLDGGQLPAHGRDAERTLPYAVGHVDVRTARQKEVHHLHVAVEGRPAQRRGLGQRGLVYRGPTLHEGLDNVQVAPSAGGPQSRRAVDLLLRGDGDYRGRVVNVENFTRYFQEVLDDAQIALLGRQNERSAFLQPRGWAERLWSHHAIPGVQDALYV